MDILKLSKFSLIAIILMSCLGNYEKEQDSQKLACLQCDTVTFYDQDNGLRLYFLGKYQKIQKSKIDHFRLGQKIGEIDFTEFDSVANLHINKMPLITSKDSLIITLDNEEKIVLHQFKNTAHYGGKKFLGCFFGSCMVGMDSVNGTISIYINRE